MMEIRKGAKLVGYIVERLREEYEDIQIGKTVVQKMVYLSGIDSEIDFDYSMYHYGPFSKRTAGALDLSKKYGYVSMEWDPEKGYFIEPTGEFSEEGLDTEIKKTVDEVVEKYGKYKAIELSMIATGIYVKENFDYGSEEELVEAVSSIKSEHDKEWIKELLLGEGIIGQGE
ncbi:MAG: hypothetical protein ACOC85_05890 [Thermoplasmatota archaeon]